MKKTTAGIFLGVGLMLVSCLGAQAAQGQQEEGYVRRKIIILGSFKDYAQALKAAQEISPKAALPFSTRGMVYDIREGLVWPKGSDEEIYADSYMARRYNEECDSGQESCITIERSNFYEGMQPGYFILVGGLFSAESPEVDRILESFRSVVPTAYAKVSKVYMGCLH